jgi:hypothetical protein
VFGDIVVWDFFGSLLVRQGKPAKIFLQGHEEMGTLYSFSRGVWGGISGFGNPGVFPPLFLP